MNLLTYSTTVEKKIHGNPDVYMEALMKKMQGNLKNLKIPSEITKGTLRFNRPVQNYQYNREEILKPLRKGQIRIKKINSNQIEILWEVELETLLVISITIGLVLGVILGLFAESSGLIIVSSILIGLFISTVTYLLGLNSILKTMNEVLETSD